MKHAHEIALGLSILFTGFAQVLLKAGASRRSSALRIFVDVRTLSGYGLMLIITVLNVYAMQKLQLKTMVAWISLTYVLVALLSWIVFKERFDRAKVCGTALVVVGLVVFSL